jgi:hypothetical protein
MRKRLAAALSLLALAGPSAAQTGFVAVDVTANAIPEFVIDDAATAHGEIAFRGGLVLRSGYTHFGSLSGFDIAPDGTFYAVTDTGFWVTGRLAEEDGWLAGVADVAMAPILGADGVPDNEVRTADAEGLRFDARDNTIIVSFEQRHRLSRFSVAELAGALPTAIALPPLPGVAGNRGIESLALAPADSPLGDGAIVIISEGADDGAGGIRGWVVGGPRAGAFSVRRHGLYDITDAAFLPNGDLFILERLFSLAEGIGMRIRRLSVNDIRPGATVDGPVVLEDDHLFQIDNMEGMALRQLPSGGVLITLVSDNNHNLLQRTLVLQFVWNETVPPQPVRRPSAN